jgi:RNA polymerase sigma factor (sigma-70 family)
VAFIIVTSAGLPEEPVPRWRSFFLEEALIAPHQLDRDLVALDEALEVLAAVDPRRAKVVELRFFGGMSNQETAEVLDISTETVTRDWKLAKTWLRRELTRGHASGS